MAVSGTSLAITVGIYIAVLVVVFLCFSLWRDSKFTRKFFAPKRYTPGVAQPPKLRSGLGAWVPQVLWMGEAEVIRCAGIDAALYLKILRMGFELFVAISLIVLIIILPINCTGGEVDNLMSNPGSTGLESNPLVWWLPPPPPPAPPGSDPPPGDSSPSDSIIKPPDFYNSTVGDAPPGMEWWNYNSDVPPLPTPYEYFLNSTNASYAEQFRTYGWMWDSSYQEMKYTFSNLDKTTIANIPSRSARLWAHAVIAWLVTFVCYRWLWKYNKEALRLRIFYLLNQPAGAESHTVLVQDVPGIAYGTILNRADGTLLKVVPKSIKEKAAQQTALLAERTKSTVTAAAKKGAGATHISKVAGPDASDAENAAAAAALSTGMMQIDAKTGRWEMRDEWLTAVEQILDQGGDVGKMVEEEFRKIFGDDLGSVHMCHNTGKLDALTAEYEKIKLAMTDLVDNYISLKRRGKELKIKKVTVLGVRMGEWGKEKYGLKPKKVEALEFYRDRLTELRRLILEEQQNARAPDNLYPAAFVTFKRRTSQVVASRTLLSEDMSTWRCQAAPRAEELIWGNLGWRIWERSGRTIAMWAAFWAMAAFFMIPVTAVQGLLTMNSFLGFVNSIPIAGAIITGILPGLALKIFLALVPLILTIMNKFAGMVSISQVDLGVVYKFFIFQVITVFLGSFIAGTFANQLDQFISDPSSILTIFGTSAPQTAIFFMTYLLLAALPQASMQLLRIVPLIIFWVKTKFLAGTERAKARLWQNQTMAYGTLIPNDSICFLLATVFCTICPIIAPVAVVYFAHNYIVWKYQHVYVYQGAYQSGGLAWVRVFDQCMTGLVFFHLMMTAILGIKKMPGPAILCAILWLFDAAFWVSVHKRFYRPHECLSLISAAEMDSKEVTAAQAAAAGAAAASPGKALSVDDEVDQRYLSPSFKFDEAEHEAALSEAARMAAVLAGGEDDKLFAEGPDSEEEQSAHDAHDIEAGISTTAEGGAAPSGSAGSAELGVEAAPASSSAAAAPGSDGIRPVSAADV